MTFQDNASPGREADRSTEIARDIARTAEALSTSEVVHRFGSANAEYIKGYTGVDHETGKHLHDGLKALGQQGRGLKQKAGVAAEIVATNRDNAEAVIGKQLGRSARADDLTRQYGTNHQIVDRIHMGEDGKVSYAQMKFESNNQGLVAKIVKKDGQYAKYLDPQEVCAKRVDIHLQSAQSADAKAMVAEARGQVQKAAEYREIADALRERAANYKDIGESEIRLEVPTEQVDSIKERCQVNATRCRRVAAGREAKAAQADQRGNFGEAHRLREEAREFREEAQRNEDLKKRVFDSGVSQSDAERAASQPLKATITSVMKTSHRAGLQGAACAAAIGGCIAVLMNIVAMARCEKDAGEAAKDAAVGTAKSAVFGYATAFTGSAIKGTMEHASSQALKNLAQTNAPTLILNICLSLGSSIQRYVVGDISEAELLTEVGEKGAGMLSGSMMAALGQVAIPIPVVGAAIGGMIGYSLSSLFYQSALDAAKGAEASRVLLQRTRAIQTAARARIAEEQATLDDFFCRELPQLREEGRHFIAALNADTDTQVRAINDFALLLGKTMEFDSQAEFDDFMLSDRPLKL